jgi:hypothetical protein
MKINVCVHEHVFRSFLKENLQAIQLEGHVASLGRFGYVHSQRRASAAWNEKYPHSIASLPLGFDYFLEFTYCIICQIYHYFLLAVIMIPMQPLLYNPFTLCLMIPIYSKNRNYFFFPPLFFSNYYFEP